MNRVGLFSLDRGINDAEAVARVSAEMFERELGAIPLQGRRAKANQRLVAAWRFAKELSVVASAIKIIEWVKNVIPFI